MQTTEKQIEITIKVPRWFAKFLMLPTKNYPHNQRVFFELLKPMTPEEWCFFWIPIIHPGVEIPTSGTRNPHGYMKACTSTLSFLTGYNEKTIEGWFYGKPYHYSVGVLLRCFHLIFKLQEYLKD
jgi:hypothetical protein